MESIRLLIKEVCTMKWNVEETKLAARMMEREKRRKVDQAYLAMKVGDYRKFMEAMKKLTK